MTTSLLVFGGGQEKAEYRFDTRQMREGAREVKDSDKFHLL